MTSNGVTSIGLLVVTAIALIVFMAGFIVIPQTSLNAKGYQLPDGWVLPSDKVNLAPNPLCDREDLKTKGFPFVTSRPYMNSPAHCFNESNFSAVLLNVAGYTSVALGIGLVAERLTSRRLR